MKRYLLLIAVVCSVSSALATDYNLINDWVFHGPNNPNGAWGYGYKLETDLGSGTFGAFAYDTVQDTTAIAGPTDRWLDDTSGGQTCGIWNVPGGVWTFPGPAVILNSWVNHAAAIHWAGNPGTYDLTAVFQTGGYAAPTATFPDVRIYVTLNDSTVLFSDHLLGFASTFTQLTVDIAAGDFLDFYIAGNPEARSTLDANLALVPEPGTLALLGLGALLLFRRIR
jgi:hypothetical protein